MTAIEDFFDEKIKLPSPPAIALKIIQAVRDEDATFEKLADIVAVDPALSARVLKIANSSLYNLPKQISSLKQATSLIGLQALNNIALSFVIVDNFHDIPQQGFDIELFWRRAITSAVAAETLAQEMKYLNQDIFLTGLLLDIGVLMLFLANPAAFTEVLDIKRVAGTELQENEKSKFGFNHAEVGALVLERWNFPSSISLQIRRHHDCVAGVDGGNAVAMLHVSDKIGSIYHGTQSNRRNIEVRNLLQKHFDIADDRAHELIDLVGEKAREVMDLFQIDAADMKPFSRIMQEANDELRRLNFSYEQVVLELKQAKQNAESLASELKEANDKLRELAFRDGLTGLYNHRFFQEMMAAELERARRYDHPLSLLLVDIDHFKKVNDTYGHAVGDEVLRSVSAKLVELLRRCDVVARYGGEEFALIIPEVGEAGARVLAQRIRRGIEQHTIEIEGVQLSVTVSIGVACSEMKSVQLSKQSLFTGSDKALYSAKENGRNRIALAA